MHTIASLSRESPKPFGNYGPHIRSGPQEKAHCQKLFLSMPECGRTCIQPTLHDAHEMERERELVPLDWAPFSSHVRYAPFGALFVQGHAFREQVHHAPLLVGNAVNGTPLRQAVVGSDKAAAAQGVTQQATENGANKRRRKVQNHGLFYTAHHFRFLFCACLLQPPPRRLAAEQVGKSAAGV